MSLYCGECGSELPSIAGDGMYVERERIVYLDCKATNIIGVDDNEAFVAHYICEHGQRDDKSCDRCEIEKGGGVGEVGA